MASGYPNTQDNFVPLVDGSTKVEAVNCNELQNAIEAIQQFVGLASSILAHNTDLITHLMEMLPSIRLSYVDADTVRASAGVSKPRKSDLSIRKFRKNTSTTDITGAHIDTGAGSFANSTDYYVFAIGDAAATTVTFKCTTSATTPASSTSYELIGGFSTNSSGDVIESSVWSIAGMRIVDLKVATKASVVTTTTVMVNDDTIPDQSVPEGGEMMTLEFVAPTSTSKILLLHLGHYSHDSTSVNRIIISVFKDSTAPAVCSWVIDKKGGDGNQILHSRLFLHYETGSAGKRNYKIYAGGDNTGTLTLNGENGARKLGGSLISLLIAVVLDN